MSDSAILLPLIMVFTMIAVTLLADRQRRKVARQRVLDEPDPGPQSRTVGNLGIAIATLEAALLDYDEGRSVRRGNAFDDAVTGDRSDSADGGPIRLLRAQTQVLEVASQVDQLLGDLPEADAIVRVLMSIEPVQDPGLVPRGLSLPEQIDVAQAAVRDAIDQLETARTWVLQQERTDRLKAEAEAIEAARPAGAGSATMRDKERS